MIFFGVGKMVGAGILVLIGSAAQAAGPAVFIAYAMAAVAVMCSAMCYADFVSRVPIAGGAYSFVYVSLGELPAFCTGWLLLFEYACGAAALGRGWTEYLYVLIHECGGDDYFPHWLRGIEFGQDGLELNLLCLLYIVLLVSVVAFGIQQSSFVNKVVTAIKIGCMVLIIIVAFTHAKTEHWTNETFMPEGTSGVLRASVLVFYSYIGFDAVASISEEVRNPSRNMPLGMLMSIGISFIIYMLVCISVTLMVPATSLSSKAPLAGAFMSVGIRWMGIAVSLSAVIGIASGTMLNLTSQSRVWMTLARDGLVPPVLAQVHPSTQTPLLATAFTGILAMLLASVLPFELLVSLMSAGTLVALVCVNVGYIGRRYVDRGLALPWRCLLSFTVFAALAVCCLVEATDDYLKSGGSWTTWALLQLTAGALGAFLALVSGGLLWHKCPSQTPVGDGAFTLIGGVAVPLVGTAMCLFMLHRTAQVHNLWGLFVWFVLGVGIYFAYGRQHSSLNPEKESLVRGGA